MNKDEIINAVDLACLANSKFTFRKKCSTCEGEPSTGKTYTGATYRAGWKDTDFALLELNIVRDPLAGLYPEDELYWLGWDRRVYTPQSGTTLHHPEGGYMRISLDYDPLQSFDSKHWKATFDEGIAQYGSSGAPLLNEDNRVVGQLHQGIGNQNTPCNVTSATFGKFNLSWEGDGTPDTRLKDWLDPGNTNTKVMDGRRYFAIKGNPVVCGTCTYEVENLEDDMRVVWSLDDSNYSISTGKFIRDSPAPNKCMIIKDEDHLLDGTLRAVIMQGSRNIAVVELPVCSMDKELVTSYRWVEGCTGPAPFPDNIASGTVEKIPVDCWVYLQADALSDMTVTHTSGVASQFTHSGNQIGFTIPSANYGGVLKVSGQGINSCSQFTYTFYTNKKPKVVDPLDPKVPRDPIDPIDTLILLVGDQPMGAQAVLPSGSLKVNLMYVVGEDDEAQTMTLSTGEVAGVLPVDEDTTWTLEVYQASTNQKVSTQTVKGATCVLDTSAFASGIYIIRAIADEQILHLKIQL